MSKFRYPLKIDPPLTPNQLKPLDTRCERIQINSLLTETEFCKLAEFLSAYPSVGLRVYGNYKKNIINLDFLRHFPFIKKFSVEVWDIDNLDGLKYLPNDLEELSIGQTHSKRISLRLLEGFPSLKKLYLEGQTNDFSAVGQLDQLEDLTLRSITLQDLSMLVTLSNLKSLDIKLGGTKDLRLLPKIGKLRYLELWLIRGLNDISTIAEVESLQFLFLQALKSVTKLPSFRNLTHLRRLHLETMKGITDLRPIRSAPVLHELLILDMPQLKPEAFSPLIGHPTLVSASIYLGSLKKNRIVQDLLNLPPITRNQREFVFE